MHRPSETLHHAYVGRGQALSAFTAHMRTESSGAAEYRVWHQILYLGYTQVSWYG
jgi:hypothetical protein